MFNQLKETFNADSLRGRFLKSSALLGFAAGLENAARLVRNMIIARILAPEEFGVMAIVLAATWAFKAFTQMGVQQCIIQNKRGSETEFLNVAWWFSTILAFVLFVVAFISAPFIAKFYNQPELLLMLRIASLTIVFDSMMSPRTYVLEKELKFSKWVVIMQGAGLFNILVAISLSFYLRNVWALVIALMCESLFRLVFSFLLCPFIPKFKIERQSMSEIYKFAIAIFGLPILLMVFQQADVFFLGKLVSVEDVGKYSLVIILSRLPNMIYSVTLGRLMVPVFSELRDDLTKFRKNFLKITNIICLFGIPFIAFLGIYSKSILSLVYGNIYASVYLTFIILCISYFIRIFNELMGSSFIAIAKPELYRNYSLVRMLIVLALLYPLIKMFALIGAAFSVLTATIVFWLLLLKRLSNILKIDLKIYFSSIIKGLSVSLLVLLSGFIMKYFSLKSNLINISVGMAICFLTWTITAYALKFKHDKLVETP